MFSRIAMLLSLARAMTLTAPLFSVLEKDISGRDLVLRLGGLFLLWKSAFEIHGSLEAAEHRNGGAALAGLSSILAQIAIPAAA
jgi:predicted tellurium resistance membrane protein TerC